MSERSRISAHLLDLQQRVARLEARILERDPPPEHLRSPWRPVYHTRTARTSTPSQSVGCGKPALYLIRPFGRDEMADLSAMRVCPPTEIRWRQPAPDDVPVCSSCGQRIDPFSDADLDWSRALTDTPTSPTSTAPSTAPTTGPVEPEITRIAQLAGDFLPPPEPSEHAQTT